MSRTYSKLLMHGLLFAGDEGDVPYYAQVPQGHTWVVRHVAISADPGGQLAWRLGLSGDPIGIGPYGGYANICQGYCGSDTLTSEWSGWHVVPEWYTLEFHVLGITGVDSVTGMGTISGFDLVD